MKRIAFVICLLVIASAYSFGQTSSDSIVMEKVFGGYKFYQGGKSLSMNQLVNVMESNEQAYKQMRSAQTTLTLTSVIGFAGGFMVGWPIGAAIAGGEPNWALAGAGAGLIAISIPLSIKFNKQAKQAVDNYNNGLQARSFWVKRELKLAVKGNGLGLMLYF